MVIVGVEIVSSSGDWVGIKVLLQSSARPERPSVQRNTQCAVRMARCCGGTVWIGHGHSRLAGRLATLDLDFGPMRKSRCVGFYTVKPDRCPATGDAISFGTTIGLLKHMRCRAQWCPGHTRRAVILLRSDSNSDLIGNAGLGDVALRITLVLTACLNILR